MKFKALTLCFSAPTNMYRASFRALAKRQCTRASSPSVTMSRPAGMFRAALLAAIAALAAAQIVTDAPPTSRGDPDLPRMREIFAHRSPACVACQRAVAHLDENMLPRVFDERAKAARGGSSVYGTFSEIIEEEVSAMCRAQTIQMERDTRKACVRMLDSHEETFVKAWYETAVVEEMNAENETNMNWVMCSQSQGIAKACPDELANLDVPALVRLETRRRFDETRKRNAEARKRQGGGGAAKNSKKPTDAFSKARERSHDASAPKRMSQREIPRPPIGSGMLETFVSSDFARRAIGGGDRGGDADVTDVLVYFAFPRRNPGKHAATLDTLGHVSSAIARAVRTKPEAGNGGKDNRAWSRGARGPKSRSGEVHTAVVAVVDAERNEIPHPWGASIDGPALILFPASGKEKPRLLPFRDAESERDLDRPSDAPTPADVLALLQRQGGRQETREAAKVAFAHMNQRILEGGGRDKFAKDEDGEL